MHICSSCFRKCDVVQPIEDADTDSLQPKNKSNKTKSETRFYCCGRVPLEGTLRRRHGMCDYLINDFQSDPSIELAAEADENQIFGITKLLNPKIPFIQDLPEELYQGRSIEICGKLLPNANRLVIANMFSFENSFDRLPKVLVRVDELADVVSTTKNKELFTICIIKRFSVNLSTGKNNNADLALHFNPRCDKHVIIRNHRIKNKWGVEEIASLQPFPFRLERNFSILIFVADEQFLIAVNKIHFCAFSFRIPIDKVKSLIILGDLVLSLVQHYDRTHYPPQIFNKRPYILLPCFLKTENSNCKFRRKIKAITTGSKIEIYGRVKILPHAFYINLQKGISIWPHPIIPFHMNYRLHQPGSHKKEREIIFNSWSNGFWEKEEIISLCPFLPATTFHVRIVCKANAYVVFVNDKFLFNFTKRFESEIDSVIIHGDVVINKVLLH